jgi:hypothetical protein
MEEKKSKEEFQLWHQEMGWVREQQYFTWFLDKELNPWFAKWKLNRRAVTSICRLRSGHTVLAHNLARFNNVPNGICTCGTSEETIHHVFWQCQKFTKERKKERKKEPNQMIAKKMEHASLESGHNSDRHGPK